MAIIQNIPNAPFGAITIHRIVVALQNVISGAKHRRLERATGATLAKLSDRSLRDIGVDRNDIRALAAVHIKRF